MRDQARSSTTSERATQLAGSQSVMRESAVLTFHWGLALRRDEAHWVPVEDGGSRLFAKIPFAGVEKFIGDAPGDVLETGGGVMALFEKAVPYALAARPVLDVFHGDPARFAYRLVTIEAADFWACLAKPDRYQL